MSTIVIAVPLALDFSIKITFFLTKNQLLSWRLADLQRPRSITA